VAAAVEAGPEVVVEASVDLVEEAAAVVALVEAGKTQFNL